MKILDTELDGVKTIDLNVFRDDRGSYTETYNEELYKEFGVKWVQDDISVSKFSVLRGIHGDNETYKLISCPYGLIYLVIVDCRQDSKYFGKWQKFILDSDIQIFVPPERGVAHLVLSKIAVFNYKQSTYYNRKNQFTYKFNDPRFDISWPIKEPILSDRDEGKS